MHRLIEKTKAAQAIINDSVREITETTNNFNIYTVAADFTTNKRMIVVVTPSLSLTQYYYDNLVDLLGDDVLLFPADEVLATALLVSSKEFLFERINTIAALLTGAPKVIVTNINGINQPIRPPGAYEEFRIHLGYQCEPSLLSKKLLSYGYKKVYTVVKVGEYAQRGSIIDIFPLFSTYPVRIDFFDTEVDDIRLFNTETQLSISKTDETVIFPVSELFYSEEELTKALGLLQELWNKGNTDEKILLNQDMMKLHNYEDMDLMARYIPFFGEYTFLLDFVKNPKVYYIEFDKLDLGIRKNESDIKSFFNEMQCSLLAPFFIHNGIRLFDNATFCYGLITLKDSYVCNVKDILPFEGSFKHLLKEIKEYINILRIVISINDGDLLKRVKEALLDAHISYQSVSDITKLRVDSVNFVSNMPVLPLFMPQEELLIITEQVILPSKHEKRKLKYKAAMGEAKRISALVELDKGDKVVHYDYGIGEYQGVTTLDMNDLKRDYIEILYANNEQLYIPIEQFDLVWKYNGSCETLSSLSSAKWSNQKKRIASKVKEYSARLLELYAKRSQAVGFAFKEDTGDQQTFEADFRYEETPDQLLAIEAVKRDMERAIPMDRLICGDVGFGKTEVALRAAFKAVMNGKQVCFLAPTTILARQHYYLFKDRMESYGVEVRLLNRFVSGANQKDSIRLLKEGLVDVLIGTHRVLSSDIVFKDLGLLIIDEEQRFGVVHKERIKEIKVNVDTLVLTATPIPRTLQMALLGIKGLSMIETPPKNRYPIQTYVTPRHDFLIKEAIEREIMRGGQVFYMYNYTEDIEDRAAHIQRLVPEAKVSYAHGQLARQQIEKKIDDFISGGTNVFVCTTIIETGIDIPNTNTLIIHDADRLGLSQLYQLRGRVGRNDRIAYAYLMYEPRKILTPQAEKRLGAIKEFTHLGSGYQIAMQDLAIRGAGDLLGEEQHGFIDNVGYEMYMKILDETIKTIQGEVKEEPQKSYPQVFSNRSINNEYIAKEDVKIEIHKKIKTLASFGDLKALKSELEDRFGVIDEQLDGFMHEVLMHRLAAILKVNQIITEDTLVTFVLTEEKSEALKSDQLFALLQEFSDIVDVRYLSKRWFIDVDKRRRNWLIRVCLFFDKLISL